MYTRLSTGAFRGAPGIPNNPGAYRSMHGPAAGLASKSVLIAFGWSVPWSKSFNISSVYTSSCYISYDPYNLWLLVPNSILLE